MTWQLYFYYVMEMNGPLAQCVSRQLGNPPRPTRKGQMSSDAEMLYDDDGQPIIVYDACGRLIIPRPTAEDEKEWCGPIAANAWFEDTAWQLIGQFARVHEAASDFNNFDLDALHARAAAFMALIEAGPENVTYAGPPNLRVVN